jgi:hypothetical protein
MESRVNSLLGKSSRHRTLLGSLEEGKPFFEQLKQMDEGTLGSPPSWYFEPDANQKMKLAGNYEDYQEKLIKSQELKSKTVRGQFARRENMFSFEKLGLSLDDSVDSAIARSIERLNTPMGKAPLSVERGSALEGAISATKGEANIAASTERMMPRSLASAGITARRSSRN